nr:Transposase, Ptta/En/Spm, plant [Ipomoea batatas]
MVKSNFNDHWPTWAQFSYETKAALWAKFQEKYHWDEDKNENVYKGFRDAISRGRKSYHPMDNVPPSSSGDIPNTSQNDSQGIESNRGGDDGHDELEAP